MEPRRALLASPPSASRVHLEVEPPPGIRAQPVLRRRRPPGRGHHPRGGGPRGGHGGRPPGWTLPQGVTTPPGERLDGVASGVDLPRRAERRRRRTAEGPAREPRTRSARHHDREPADRAQLHLERLSGRPPRPLEHSSTPRHPPLPRWERRHSGGRWPRGHRGQHRTPPAGVTLCAEVLARERAVHVRRRQACGLRARGRAREADAVRALPAAAVRAPRLRAAAVTVSGVRSMDQAPPDASGPRTVTRRAAGGARPAPGWLPSGPPRPSTRRTRLSKGAFTWV
ncbi:hypothetical protein QJS66_08580 [Kocuria rhizophila]|nr:hypothetical protein QJS66_08580 [Kocuria rhizophila]